ncbi:MAG: hypothetical protein ACO36I_11705 [Candidatus Latescibacterota bacterium]
MPKLENVNLFVDSAISGLTTRPITATAGMGCDGFSKVLLV